MRVTLAAADTYRAAAIGQLKLWAEKTRRRISWIAAGRPCQRAFDAVAAPIPGVRPAADRHRRPAAYQKHLRDELTKVRSS